MVVYSLNLKLSGTLSHRLKGYYISTNPEYHVMWSYGRVGRRLAARSLEPPENDPNLPAQTWAVWLRGVAVPFISSKDHRHTDRIRTFTRGSEGGGPMIPKWTAGFEGYTPNACVCSFCFRGFGSFVWVCPKASTIQSVGSDRGGRPRRQKKRISK
jgi:hypothetical protein